MTQATLVVVRDLHGGYHLALTETGDPVIPNPVAVFANGDPDRKKCRKLGVIWNERDAMRVAALLNIPILKVVNQ